MERLLSPWLALVLLHLFLVSSRQLSAASAFQSDELLQDDEEFGLLGAVQSPNPDMSTPISSSTPRGKKIATDLPQETKSSLQFSLEHNLGGSGEFLPAGTFSARVKPSVRGSGGPTLTKLRFSRHAFTAKDESTFEKLLRDDDFYTIRLPSNILVPSGKGYIISSIRARCLVKGKLDEQFIIHMDGGSIVAVNYGSSGTCHYPRILKLPSTWTFNSYTVLKYSEHARRTSTFAEDMLTAQNGEVEGVKPIEKSFWAKYWLYLIPLGFIVMNAVTQAMNMPEEQSNGQPGAAVSQGQQPVAQRAPSTAARRRQ